MNVRYCQFDCIVRVWNNRKRPVDNEHEVSSSIKEIFPDDGENDQRHLMPGDHFMALIKFSSGVKYLCRRITGLVINGDDSERLTWHDQSHVDSLLTRVWPVSIRRYTSRTGYSMYSYISRSFARDAIQSILIRGVACKISELKDDADRARNKLSREMIFFL